MIENFYHFWYNSLGRSCSLIEVKDKKILFYSYRKIRNEKVKFTHFSGEILSEKIVNETRILQFYMEYVEGYKYKDNYCSGEFIIFPEIIKEYDPNVSNGTTTDSFLVNKLINIDYVSQKNYDYNIKIITIT